MKLEDQNILFFTRTMKLGGTENVILQLCEIFRPLVNKIVVCSCGGINVEKLTALGIRHYDIPDLADKNLKTVLQILNILRGITKTEHITVIHSHHRMAALYAGLVCGKNIIRVANAHNTFRDKKKLTRMAYKGTYLVAVGDSVKNNLIEYFELPENQIEVIYNAVPSFNESTNVIADLEREKKDGHILVGNVGRLSAQKGMEYFIRSAVLVLQKYPKTRFYIVGDGEDSDKLKKLAAELLPFGEMTFMGYRSDVQNVMSQFDFVVLSSLWEGFPLTPIEAFSVGKTVVATAVDGTPEIVRDEENGLLVKPGVVEELAEAEIRLCQDSQFRRELERNAIQDYHNKFSMDILADRYICYYTQLFARQKG